MTYTPEERAAIIASGGNPDLLHLVGGFPVEPPEPEPTCGHRCGSSGRFVCDRKPGHTTADPPTPHHYRG